MTDSFPRRQARTRRFTLGAPRGFTISADGRRVVFLRSQDGADPVTCLWSLDVATGSERLVTDPASLGPSDGELPAEERARRERAREQAGGIVGYACDRAVELAAFTLAGGLYLVDLVAPGALPRAVAAPAGVVDPRPDPTGRRVAFVAGGTLWRHEVDTGLTTAWAEPESSTVRWGLADFIAAEEMTRMRGYWWAPDGRSVLVARTDDAPVHRWWLADPANPERPAVEHPYPAAGTPNAVTELYLLDVDGRRRPVAWNAGGEEYLVDVTWGSGDPLITVMPRDQRAIRVLALDPASGDLRPVAENTDEHWVDIVAGVPARLGDDGALVWTADLDDTRRLLVEGHPVTPPGTQVRSVLSTDGDTVLFTAAADPGESRLWTYRLGDDAPRRLTGEPGVYSGRSRAGVTVISRQDLDSDGTSVTVRGPDGTVVPVVSRAASPDLVPRVSLLDPPTPGPAPAGAVARPRGPRVAVLLPRDHRAGQRLPVLMDPYGGPHAQRVLSARGAYLTSQWFADQGFAVVVADGRGTPGCGPAHERAVAGDLAGPVLADQVDALGMAVAAHPDLDAGRVGIRGWSFGGYLAALAVLRRPEVFHAAVAGAPVTDWALYDTCYTERYLGDPAVDPGVYQRSSLLLDAPKLSRPLMLIHGLADDNVVAAHTLRLSGLLLAAGRPHTVLPLSGVTHMTPQEEVAENLLLVQVEFLRTALGGPR